MLKYLIIPITLFLQVNHLLAQSSNEELNGSFRFNRYLITDFQNQREKVSRNQEDILENKRVTVVGYDKSSDKVYYKYWKFGESYPTGVQDTYNDKVFEMPREEFLLLTERLYKKFKGFSVGAYTVPFRLRGIGGGSENNNNFDFESSLSLQANFVAGFGSYDKKESILDLSLGLGLTAVNLNNNNSIVNEDRTASAFTASLGLLYKPVSNANIGIFFGSDFLGANDDDVNWIYDGKGWIGLGINISFNKVDTAQSPSSIGEQKRN